MIAKTFTREVFPIALYEERDGCLNGDMLSKERNTIAYSYYEQNFYSDFSNAFEEDELDVYGVAPSWVSYDHIKPVLDKRYE